MSIILVDKDSGSRDQCKLTQAEYTINCHYTIEGGILGDHVFKENTSHKELDHKARICSPPHKLKGRGDVFKKYNIIKTLPVKILIEISAQEFE